MHRYFIKTPWWVRKMFKHYVWRLPATGNAVYLTFDDGPHPQITNWVLDVLKSYKAKATFFCIGKNVVQNPEVYQRIITEGHTTGNHTQNHLNGWKTPTAQYLADVAAAAQYITSNLFRPPYGKIKKLQARQIKNAWHHETKIIMWDVLSADFDQSISKEECLQNVLKNVRAGSVVVFHDSEKAAENLKYVLPKILEDLSSRGFRFQRIESGVATNN